MSIKGGGPGLDSALGVQRPDLQSNVTVIKTARSRDPVSKAQTQLLRSRELTVDDAAGTTFEGMVKSKAITPTYHPGILWMLTHQNNTLLQCITAMEVNIDGTGYQIERRDGKPVGDDDQKVAQIKAFFDEPYPGESFVTQRRQLRRDLESTGCGYLEVIRNVGGDVVFLRRLDAKLTRLVALDEPVAVDREVERMGVKATVKMQVRERRFVQQVGNKFRYFKEYGASRDLDSDTGEWVTSGPTEPTAPPTGPVSADRKATEVIFLTVVPDVATAYGVPRWISQMPSVLGSRKAEEFNLEFFDAGGLPPALILIQGGQLSTESRTALTNYLAGKAKFKQRGVIAEVFPASGDIGSSGSVRVTVERFGDERQKDSMFGNYDERCAEHVRQAFRLPPLFVGRSQDHNFATAYASYMVAEAQVFKPEREEFDEIVNVKIMKAIAPEYVFRSLPLAIQDVVNQLKALAMVKDMVDPEKLIETVNEIASMTLTVREDLDEQEALAQVNSLLGRDALGSKLDRRDAKTGEGEDDDADVTVQTTKRGKIKKLDDSVLTELAQDWADHLSGRREFAPDSVATMHLLIKSFTAPVRRLFNAYVTARAVDPIHDPAGTATLMSCAAECLHDHD